MHPNPAFRAQEAEKNLAYARSRAFGVLAVGNGDNAPMLSHVPFLLDPKGDWAHLHLVRSNPIARALRHGAMNARIAVSGPDSYVSPDWYGIDDQVPTWNYIAVHLTGLLELRPQSQLRELLDRQSAFFEDQLRPKTPWTTAKMTQDVMDSMMRQIVPCALKVTGVDGTWKMNQNKPDQARLNAAVELGRLKMGSETRRLSDLMQQSSESGTSPERDQK